jgi:hypothetical protein
MVSKKNDDGLEYAINKTDIVGLVCTAWKSSFARVKTNCQAIIKRGWGQRALNYNALCHSEVLTSKPGSMTNKSDLNTLQSTVALESQI